MFANARVGRKATKASLIAIVVFSAFGPCTLAYPQTDGEAVQKDQEQHSKVSAEQPLGKKQAREFLNDFLVGRQKIRSGHFLASGNLDPNDDNVTVECCFSSNQWMIHRKTSVGSWKVLVTGEYCYVKAGNSDVLLIDEETAKAYARWFDVRTVGLADWIGLVKTNSSKLENLVRIYRDGPTPLRVAQSGNGTVNLKYGPYPSIDAEQTLVLDTERGCVPVFAKFYGEKVNQTRKTTWDSVGGAWVPTKYSERHGSEKKFEIDFNWLSVNSDNLENFDSRKVFPGFNRFIKERDGKTVLVNRPVEKWWSLPAQNLNVPSNPSSTTSD